MRATFSFLSLLVGFIGYPAQATAQTLTAPVTITIPFGGGPTPPWGGIQTIGTLTVTNSPTAASIIALFQFDPASPHACLDEVYDFTWINVETSYLANGSLQTVDPCLGTLPAIDPPVAPCLCAPGFACDTEPLYWDTAGTGPASWSDNHIEGAWSQFSDQRFNNTPVAIGFRTFLVLRRVEAYSPANFTVVDLVKAFSWTYVRTTTTSSTFLGAAISNPSFSDYALLNTALANANPPFDPGWSINFPFAGTVPVAYGLSVAANVGSVGNVCPPSASIDWSFNWGGGISLNSNFSPLYGPCFNTVTANVFSQGIVGGSAYLVILVVGPIGPGVPLPMCQSGVTCSLYVNPVLMFTAYNSSPPTTFTTLMWPIPLDSAYLGLQLGQQVIRIALGPGVPSPCVGSVSAAGTFEVY